MQLLYDNARLDGAAHAAGSVAGASTAELPLTARRPVMSRRDCLICFLISGVHLAQRTATHPHE